MSDGVTGYSPYKLEQQTKEIGEQSTYGKTSAISTSGIRRDPRGFAYMQSASDREATPNESQRYRYQKILDEFIDKRQSSNYLKDESQKQPQNGELFNQNGAYMAGIKDFSKHEHHRPIDASRNEYKFHTSNPKRRFEEGEFQYTDRSEQKPKGFDAFRKDRLDERDDTNHSNVKKGINDYESSKEREDFDDYPGIEKIKPSSRFMNDRKKDDHSYERGFKSDRVKEALRGTQYQTSSDLQFASPSSNFISGGRSRENADQFSARGHKPEGVPVSGFDHTKEGPTNERGASFGARSLAQKKPSNLASLIPNHELSKHFGEPKPSSALDSAFHHYRMRQGLVKAGGGIPSNPYGPHVAEKSDLEEDRQKSHYWQIKASATDDADIKRILGKVKKAEHGVMTPNQEYGSQKGYLGQKSQTPFDQGGRIQEKTSFNLSATSPRPQDPYMKAGVGHLSSSRIHSVTSRPQATSKLLEYSSNRRFVN